MTTKKEIIEWAKSENLDAEKVVNFVREAIEANRTSWCIPITMYVGFHRDNRIEFVERGYRKNTTGQYVPNAYLANFGWKNTYYQHAEMTISLADRDFHLSHEYVEKQWAVICDGKLVRTFGREVGSQEMARGEAEANGWGARAVLLSQSEIDALG